ncbi:MAG: hypothetical protein QM486_02815 [Flavobacteriaceae bacterium]
MEKGLFIMIIVFVVIALLHIISLKITRISEKKKIKFRKVFWYFYGILFLTQGVIRMIEKQKFIVISVIMCIVGLSSLVLNYLDKIETKSNAK